MKPTRMRDRRGETLDSRKNLEFLAACQLTSRRSDRDESGGSSARDSGGEVSVGLDRENCRGAVEGYRSCPLESLPKKLDSLSDLGCLGEKFDRRFEVAVEGVNNAKVRTSSKSC